MSDDAEQDAPNVFRCRSRCEVQPGGPEVQCMRPRWHDGGHRGEFSKAIAWPNLMSNTVEAIRVNQS